MLARVLAAAPRTVRKLRSTDHLLFVLRDTARALVGVCSAPATRASQSGRLGPLKESFPVTSFFSSASFYLSGH